MEASACKLWRSREMVTVARVRPPFLYATAQSRASRLPSISRIPLLCVAHVIDSHFIMLTPEEWNSVKLFATAKNILSCYLSLALSNHPVLDANSLAGVRIGPASGISSSEDSGHAGFEVFVDFDTPINRKPGLFRHSQRRSHSYTQNQEVCLYNCSTG